MPLIDEFEIGDEFVCCKCKALRWVTHIGQWTGDLHDDSEKCPHPLMIRVEGYHCFTTQALERERRGVEMKAETGIMMGSPFVCEGCGQQRMAATENEYSIGALNICTAISGGRAYCSIKKEAITPKNPPPKLESTPACTCDMQTLMRVGCPSNQGQRCPSAGV